ncbi:MAG: fructosamine kinase family protein [Pseudomonadota bacterium]
MTLWDRVAAAIAEATQRPFHLRAQTPVSGGDINRSHRLEGADGSCYFVKLNDVRHAAIPSTWLRTGFAAEAAGLNALAATQTLRIPCVIAHGTAQGHNFLVLEQLDLHAHGDATRLGTQLAVLHRCTAERFGFMQDNFIGTTPQPNAWSDSWIEFWAERRLGHQLDLARHNGLGKTLQTTGAQLLETLPVFFEGYTPQPSLLHGDLWRGNHSYLADGTPTIFDPAVYYGDRECDLAMTELFGGYPDDFYTAYHKAWPLDAGYTQRRQLYNLYHILNHANLFGGGYVPQAQRMMRALLTAA